MKGPLDGKVAIVTGGSRGIGAAVGARLAEDGAAVVVSGRDGDRLQRTVRDLEAQGRAALGVLAYRCAVNPVTGRSELAIMSFSREEEVSLGAKAYVPAVQQQGGFYRDKALEEYVQGVGMRIARVSHRPDLDYRYRVLNSSVPNAFALPGGYVYVTRGLLPLVNNEDELAGVVGHEIGHVAARHSVQKISKQGPIAAGRP